MCEQSIVDAEVHTTAAWLAFETAFVALVRQPPSTACERDFSGNPQACLLTPSVDGNLVDLVVAA